MHGVVCGILAISVQYRHFPVPLARFREANMGTSVKHENEWRFVDPELASSVARRYFDAKITVANRLAFEVYTIDGVPAAATLYCESSNQVEAFFLDIGLLILFDAAEDMRAKFYARHQNISFQNAKNAHVFLSCV